MTKNLIIFGSVFLVLIVVASKDVPEYILTAIWSKETLKLGVDSTTYTYP